MADPIEDLFAERVRDLRTRLGLSQGEVAARMTALGATMKVPAVSMIESGRRRLTLAELATLLLALGGTPTAAAEVRVAMLNLHGVEDQRVRDQLAALGGTDLGGAAPLGVGWDAPAEVQTEAERIARDRRRERLMQRIGMAIPWRDLGLGSGPEFGELSAIDRGMIEDALDELFETSDPLEARANLVRDAEADDLEARLFAGLPLSTGGVEVSAQTRGWATRRMIEMIVEELRG